MTISHRCALWRDIKIHPESDWLWGTELRREEIGFKQPDGTFGPAFWSLLDEQSQTFSVYKGEKCPFCGMVLSTLLDGGTA